ncbi:hypothetical protein QQS21_010226 [Conoideocrella luteorostrata]|uniref:Uncharacterized protein n=1 Tax=Conoideocrella luteorostrata TaxID=1105319 RepID=A0AAJ0CFQ3_9HYPO|nr:hypothetical protein QQS21_010226 [Conoideocrella luteorostrata]
MQLEGKIVGTLAEEGILTHNPRNQLCSDANAPAMLAAAGRIASQLIAAAVTPNPGTSPRYSLRHRRPTDPPAPPQAAAPPILPADRILQLQWRMLVVGLKRDDGPGGLPMVQEVYILDDHNPRKPYESQRELLQLSTQELQGGSGVGQLDRDEYPPAIAREGGPGAVVTFIEAGDNRMAGSLMGQQFLNYRMDPQPDGHRPFRNGDTFRYAIIHANMDSIEYFGEHLIDETQINRPLGN